MSFKSSSKDFSLDGSVLKAKCSNSQNEYVDASLDLNSYIGNNDGDFTTENSGFYSVALNVSLDPTNVVLSASLKTKDNLYIDRTFELDLYVGNDHGTLKFNVPFVSL